MPPEVADVLGKFGNPVLVGIVTATVVASFFSERIAKILGPVGKLGRWWQTREERAEADAQALYRARRKALEEVAGDQLADLERQLAYFLGVVEHLRDENQALRDEVVAVHRLLDDQRRQLQQIDHKLDTGERAAVIPPPPQGRRHAAPPDDEPATQRIYP